MSSNANHVQQKMYGQHFKPEIPRYAQNMPPHNHYNPSQQQQDHQFAPIPIGVVMQANTDIDSLLQVHRRKMIRRAANRRSAQQSRARKKALMGDLKIENLRLQKFADILDSQPELTFCIDKNGSITFMSDSASNSMKTTNSDDNDDDPTHLSQILTEESVGTVMECIAQIRADQCASNLGPGSLHGEHDGSLCISSVQSVYYHDASGFQVAGYIRCSRLMKRAPFDDGTEPTVVVDFGPASKKCKTGTGTGTGATIPLTASNVAAASSSSGVFAIGGGVPQSQSQSQQYSTALSANSVNNVGGGIVNVGGQGGGGQGGGGSGQEYTHEERHHIEAEEEFVCAIRPVDASFPHSGGSQLFSSLLSTASIVAHDLDLRSTNSEFPYQPHNSFPPPAACVFESQMQMQSTNYPHQPQETNHTQNHGSQNQNHGNHPLQMYSSMSSISASATSLSIVPDRDRCQGQSNGYTEADRDRVLDDQPL